MTTIAPRVPVYVWFTPFRIARGTDPDTGESAYRAEWTRGCMKGRAASPWRPTKDAVRASMMNLYADVNEVQGGAS